MPMRTLLLLLGAALLLPAQKYSGPRPPKPDVPYLLHADSLVTTEVAEAKEENRKDDILYVVSGAASSAKTPLAAPVLIMQADKLQPERLQLYKLDSKNGQREILFSRKKKIAAHPLIISVNKLSSDNIYKIEVNQSLENGEYSLTPEGSNQVFCFAVY
jgi:hypothetical protein